MQVKDEQFDISCRNCKRPFYFKSIALHAEKNRTCNPFYSQDQIKDLKDQSSEISAIKKRIKDAERYKRKKIKMAEKYQEEKEEIAKNYDSVVRAERYQKQKAEIAEKYQGEKKEIAKKYQGKKEEIAEKYQEKKEEIAKNYDSMIRAEKYQKQKAQITEKYQKKKAQIAKKYDKVKRASNYKKARVDIALKYLKNKYNIAKRYDKNVRQKKYKKIMAKISNERRELLRKKKSELGKLFDRFCDDLFQNVYNQILNDLHKFSYEKLPVQRDFYEEEHNCPFLEEVFEKGKWSSNIFHFQTYDCEQKNSSVFYLHGYGFKDLEPKTCEELNSRLSEYHGRKQWCIRCMDESEWGDIIEKALEENFEELVEKYMTEDADFEVNRELRYAFFLDLDRREIDRRPDIYYDAALKCRNKAFKTLFLEEHEDIYKQTQRTAISKWQNYRKDEVVSMKRREEFDREINLLDLKVKELKSAGVYVSDEISKMFRDEFMFAWEQEFLIFKERVPDMMRNINTNRKEYALERLEEIKELEKNSTNKEIRRFIAKAKIEVEEIYEEYEKEIEDAYEMSVCEDCDITFKEYFCFIDLVELYPSFKGSRINPFNPRFCSNLDEYSFWFHRIWRDIESKKAKCACNTCTNNLHSTNECERVIRQRLQNIPIRTCPLCQESISHGAYERKDKHAHIKMASASKVTCQYSVIMNDPCSHDEKFVKWCWICHQKKRNFRLANQDVSHSSPPLQFDSIFDFYDLPIPPYQINSM